MGHMVGHKGLYCGKILVSMLILDMEGLLIIDMFEGKIKFNFRLVEIKVTV